MLRGNSPFQYRVKKTLFSCECFLCYYGGQLKTAVKDGNDREDRR